MQKKATSIKMETFQKSLELVKEDLNIKLDNISETDIKTGKKTTKKTYTPIDPTRPASIIDTDGKKHQLHNAALTTEETEESASCKNKNSYNSEIFQEFKSEKNQSGSAKATSVKKEKVMQLDRDAFSFWNVLWLLIPLAVWLLYKKYKNKIRLV